MGRAIPKGSRRKAIVLGNQLSVVQELGRNGIDCILMNHHRTISSRSRYTSYVQCPDPSTAEDKAIDGLYALCSKEGNRPVLLPATDQWSMALSRHADRLREVSAPCIASKAAVELMLNKEQFCRWGQERGFMTPRCWSIHEINQLSESDFPLVIKPKLHRWSSNGDPEKFHKEMIRLRFTLIRNRLELERFLTEEKKFLDHLFLQQYVKGHSDRMYNVSFYVDAFHQVLASVAGHKIRGCLTNHGDCNLGENIVPPPELLKNSQQIIDALRYTGVVEFEYKKDSETDEFKLIEVNPHFWSWCGITPACGVNIPLIAYQDMAGEYDPTTQVPFLGTVKFVRLLPDFLNCLIYPRMEHRGIALPLKYWRNSLKADRTVYHEFKYRDWLVSVLLMKETYDNLIERSPFGIRKASKGMEQGASTDLPNVQEY